MHATAAPVAAPAASISASLKERAKAAVLGGLLADAATMPLHWIYDVVKIKELLASKGLDKPEFFPEPSCPFYKHPFGSLSPYGHELIPLLRSMADNGGDFDELKYATAFHEYFTKQEPEAYRNKSVKTLVAAYEEGKRGRECGDAVDFQANCFAKASLLVARYAGKPELRERVEAAVRVQQNNDAAVRYGVAGALLLERVVLGSSLADALAWAAGGGLEDQEVRELVVRALGTRTAPLQELQFQPATYMAEMMNKLLAAKESLTPYEVSVWLNGPACSNPSAFANVAMTAAQYGDYAAGVRANLLAGGDNCSRSCLIGALLAAEGGLASLPAEWRAKCTKFGEYEALADRILAAP